MSVYVIQTGTFDVTAGGRSGTPVLTVPQATNGNIVRVQATFNANTGSGNGFYYSIETLESSDVTKTTALTGVVNDTSGWVGTSLVTYFVVQNISSPTGVEDIQFEVLFQQNDLNGVGQVNSFFLEAAIVSSAP